MKRIFLVVLTAFVMVVGLTVGPVAAQKPATAGAARQVGGTFSGYVTSVAVCDPSSGAFVGINSTADFQVDASFLGDGGRLSYEMGPNGYGGWEFTSPGGIITGTVRQDIWANSPPDWDFYSQEYFDAFYGTGRFEGMTAGALETSVRSFSLPDPFPPPCGNTLNVWQEGTLSGVLGFGPGLYSVFPDGGPTGTGTWTLLDSGPGPEPRIGIDETLTVQLETYGTATIDVVYTHWYPRFYYTQDEVTRIPGVDSAMPNMVVIEGQGWSLTGFVSYSGIGPPGWERNITITGGTGQFRNASGGVLRLVGGQTTAEIGQVELSALLYGFVV